ncbi:helix-turn-helix DNA-binding domain protein [Gordonia phage Skog]|uniref:Helix-turn-helix DNA-binding domain protein n=1 Tax=Gordonia phage Skog TaxID=2704033 RepID=A0A6G6XJG8_9CAUD|nr:helix-turn-helix DNA binding domain protein [Gordonia phage Skog]QIG58259.1 helix-turn-helix DNA-binding domain protein [Gordonia phage Skog]
MFSSCPDGTCGSCIGCAMPEEPVVTPTAHARTTDPISSHLSAPDTSTRLAHRWRLLLAYDIGASLTDEEAARIAGFEPGDGMWKRCSDLRRDGLIAPVVIGPGLPVLVIGSRGRPVQVCRITEAGERAIDGLDSP